MSLPFDALSTPSTTPASTTPSTTPVNVKAVTLEDAFLMLCYILQTPEDKINAFKAQYTDMNIDSRRAYLRTGIIERSECSSTLNDNELVECSNKIMDDYVMLLIVLAMNQGSIPVDKLTKLVEYSESNTVPKQMKRISDFLQKHQNKEGKWPWWVIIVIVSVCFIFMGYLAYVLFKSPSRDQTLVQVPVSNQPVITPLVRSKTKSTRKKSRR